MAGTQRPSPMSQSLRRLARKAREDPRAQFTSIAHLMTEEVYYAAWRRLEKGASAGVDGVTAKAYAANLDENLRALHARVKAQRYRPQPVRRVYIPKEGGQMRPLGVPALEDKLVQGVVRLVLDPIYEQAFLPCSLGFRPGRSPHQALATLQQAITRQKVSHVLDIDIKGFFDNMDHGHLLRFVQHRVKDRSILRLLRLWLRAGVLEAGAIHRSPTGTPQGGAISPLLANIYLHYVLDLWAERRLRKSLRGEMVLVRYADDAIVGFQHADDAETFRRALAGRLAQFGLELNAAKTRLLEFGRFAAERAARRGKKPETFDFLGFTHICGRTRRGWFQVRRKTSKKRLRRFVTATGKWCKANRHVPLPDQWRILCGKLRGHYQYYGVAGNRNCLQVVYERVVRGWRQWLNRRSQRARMPWLRFTALLRRYPLPRPVLRLMSPVAVQGVLF
ncbi:MAG: group II intron reverse transcriptase/maturase [Elusimicrobia bacterium]|nr:group II intron reverse transcriptase/maturase [Elusimicrobiota bacterium]